MKTLTLLAISYFSLNALSAGDSGPTSNAANQITPDLEWIKSEVLQIFKTKTSTSGENLQELISVDWNSLTQNSISTATGHFTDRNAIQMLLTVPANSVNGANLGWEKNLWLLVQKDSTGYHTISSIRGDIAYQSAIVDMDGDGFDEISMINRMKSNQGIQHVSYKLYSFKTKNLIYVSETVDNWNYNKENARTKLVKGDLLYNVLETQFVDIDNDGKMEIVEKWIEFRYAGGKRISDIEQKKKMKIKSRILNFKDGIYQ